MKENEEQQVEANVPEFMKGGDTPQDENWRLMTILQMRWPDAAALEKEDRQFLLEKSVEVEKFLQEQQPQQPQVQEQPQMQQPQMQQQMQPQMQQQLQQPQMQAQMQPQQSAGQMPPQMQMQPQMQPQMQMPPHMEMQAQQLSTDMKDVLPDTTLGSK